MKRKKAATPLLRDLKAGSSPRAYTDMGLKTPDEKAKNEKAPLMLSYTEHDNAQAVEITVSGRVTREEFDRLAAKLEAFIARHGQVRVLEHVTDFEGMDAPALWHDMKFSFRHLKDFNRIAVVADPNIRNLWSSLVSPFITCEVEHFAPDQINEARDWLMWPEGAADI